MNLELNKIKIYRITHIDNIPHILKFGITHKNSSNKNPYYKSIGDKSLIETRNKKTVIIENTEDNSNNCSIVLGNYIPFYYGVRMPMLYVTQHGGNFVENETSPEDIFYLVCSLNKIVTSYYDYYFTDGHATDNLTSFYDKTRINELINIIDWEAVKLKYWGGDENLDLKRKKQTEFLISDDLPPDFIIGYGCFNEIAKKRLISFGIDENKIKLIPEAYY